MRILRWGAAAALAFGLLAAPATSQPADDPLIGLWTGQYIFDPGLSGPLTLTRNGESWHASIAGVTTDFRANGNAVAFTFPDNRGGFRGTLGAGGIAGFWIQPGASSADPDDAQRYATPVALAGDGQDTWRGTVVLHPNRFSLYLRIFRGEDGALTAAFRNPEVNSRGGASQFRVLHDGGIITFAAQPDPARAEIHLAATLLRGRIQITWPDLHRKLELARATPDQTAHFYARDPSAAPYAYREPEDAQDGWRVARARDTGMDEDKLAHLVQEIAAFDPSAKHPILIHSLLIAHHGRLVLDEYFHGFTREEQHDIRSAGKTFSSVILGALMRQGITIAPETPVYPLLASLGPFANPDPRKDKITLAQLMTHTSGLACDDNDDNSPGREDALQTQHAQPSWWKYTLDLPVAHDPGTRYAYCSGGMNLAGAALTTAARTAMPELFDRDVAQPLQWGPYYWNLMPDGEGYLGGGAFVRPRDLLKLGQAYLDGGVWNGRRIVDASWVGQSTAPRIAITPDTTGLSPDAFANSYFPGEDGYAWHLAKLNANGRIYEAYGAGGNGGQLLVVVPALELVVVFTGGNYGQGGIWNKWRDAIIPDEIIPAVVK